MSKTNNFNKYLLEKCVIGNGIINGIINAIIFYMLEKGHPDKIFHAQDIVTDLAATSLILGILLALIVFPLTQKDVTSGKLTMQEGTNKIASLLPNKKFLTVLSIGLVTMVLTTIITFAVVNLFSLSPLTVKTMGIFKGVMCTIAGIIAGYMTIVKTIYSQAK